MEKQVSVAPTRGGGPDAGIDKPRGMLVAFMKAKRKKNATRHQTKNENSFRQASRRSTERKKGGEGI